jgi:hypothetical protein
MMNATHSIVGLTAAALLTGASAIGVARSSDAEQVSHAAEHMSSPCSTTWSRSMSQKRWSTSEGSN